MLFLPIKAKWLKMIIEGTKKEEYREIKEYWHKRLTTEKICSSVLTEIKKGKKEYCFEVILRNGYSNEAPMARVVVYLSKGFGKTEWGAPENKRVYILNIVKICDTLNSHKLFIKNKGGKNV